MNNTAYLHYLSFSINIEIYFKNETQNDIQLLAYV